MGRYSGGDIFSFAGSSDGAGFNVEVPKAGLGVAFDVVFDVAFGVGVGLGLAAVCRAACFATAA